VAHAALYVAGITYVRTLAFVMAFLGELMIFGCPLRDQGAEAETREVLRVRAERRGAGAPCGVGHVAEGTIHDELAAAEEVRSRGVCGAEERREEEERTASIVSI
jgi:hypothetical protein